MVDALAAVPPVFAVAAAALLLPVLPRRIGYTAAFAAVASLVPWSVYAPEGAHLATRFLGFDVVLFNVDEFSRMMGVLFGIISMGAVLYAYSSDAPRSMASYALSYVAVSVGAVFAGDWLVLLFFWELMAVTSTILVWQHGGEAVRAGYRYAILHGAGGSLFMFAVIWHYVDVGSFLFTAETGIATGMPALLAALGIGVNVGFIGLHTWLPDTYPRPHVAASVFLCVFTTKTGVYTMLRAFPDGGIWLAYMGGGMAVYGVFFALLQYDMRRLLSYHIQAQVGYMLAGVGIGTALATSGAMAHVYNHVLYKGLLFMTAGVIVYRTGRNNLADLGGLRKEMPVTFAAFAVGALSIAAFPGFNGFISKGMIVTAAHHEHMEALWWLLIIGGVGTYMSFLKFGYYAFFNGESDLSPAAAEPGQKAAMIGIASLCVIYGLFPDVLYAIVPGEGVHEAHPYTTGHIVEALGIAAAGIVGYAALRNPISQLSWFPDLDRVYNPAVFYGSRAIVHGVTETYAAVDRVAVRMDELTKSVLFNPVEWVERLSPVSVFETLDEDRLSTDGDSPRAPSLRADIGATMVFITAAVITVFFILL